MHSDRGFIVRSFPSSLLWLPTAINVFIAAEILCLYWERFSGVGNTAQGEIGPFMHIIGISTPIALVIVVGWVALAVLRANVHQDRETPNQRGALALALFNIAAPALLWLELLWLT